MTTTAAIALANLKQGATQAQLEYLEVLEQEILNGEKSENTLIYRYRQDGMYIKVEELIVPCKGDRARIAGLLTTLDKPITTYTDTTGPIQATMYSRIRSKAYFVQKLQDEIKPAIEHLNQRAKALTKEARMIKERVLSIAHTNDGLLVENVKEAGEN